MKGGGLSLCHVLQFPEILELLLHAKGTWPVIRRFSERTSQGAEEDLRNSRPTQHRFPSKTTAFSDGNPNSCHHRSP